MFEVERKFALTEENERALLAGAEFVGTKTFTDVYYDTSLFALTTKDTWLRSRDGRFELKLPLNKNRVGERVADQYHEIEEEEAIRKELGFPVDGMFAEALKAHEYTPIAQITTTRRKYKKGEFVLDLDDMDYGYKVGEIELMVSDMAEMEGAAQKIVAFGEAQGLSLVPVRGKVLEYIRRYNPPHFEALKAKGLTL